MRTRMAKPLDFREVLGPDFGLATIQSPPGIYVELELDILERPVHRFFRDGWERRPILAARAFRDAVFEGLPQDWLSAVLEVFQCLREISRGTGVRRTTTGGVGYWGIYNDGSSPGRHPRRTYSAGRYTENGARDMALFARAQALVRQSQPWLLGEVKAQSS